MWTYFNGKKTIIGSAFLVLAAIGNKIMIEIWGVEWVWLPNLIITFEWIGMILGGIGLGHKVIKT